MSVPIVLGGPTAIGKSGLALALADVVDGEIVCADSRQLFAGMQLVAAGPSSDEAARTPHHLYGVVDPNDSMSAGMWIERADTVIDDVMARGKTPILVGGSGMYLRAWRYGLADVPPRDDALRARLEAECAERGVPALHARLATIDPAAAARIEPTDPIRVVRALEVHALTGELPSARRTSHDAERPPRRPARFVLLDEELAWLTPRIERRARQMFDQGLVEEAIALRARLPEGHRLLETLGIQEALGLHAGRLTLDDAVAGTALRTRQYARRQRTWFRVEPWWTRVSPRSLDVLSIAAAQA